MFDRIQHIHYPNVQKVLPAVYGDELSYYELLAKFEDKINNLITLANQLGVDVAWAVDAMKNIANLDEIDAQVQALQETADEIQSTLEALPSYAEFTTMSAVLSEKLFVFDTVAEMSTCSFLQVGNICRTLGYYNKCDGGGAYYIINSEHSSYEFLDIAIDNVFATTLINSNTIELAKLGALKNTDISTLIVNAINYLNSEYPITTISATNYIGGGKIIIPEGTYNIENTVSITNVKCITFEGNEKTSTILNVTNDIGFTNRVEGDIPQASYVTFKNITFTNGRGIELIRGANAQVINCRFVDITGVALALYLTVNVLIKECRFFNCDTGLLLGSIGVGPSTTLTTELCYFAHCNTGMSIAFSVNNYANSVHINKCVFEYCTLQGFRAYGNSTNTTEVNMCECYFEGNSQSSVFNNIQLTFTENFIDTTEPSIVLENIKYSEVVCFKQRDAILRNISSHVTFRVLENGYMRSINPFFMSVYGNYITHSSLDINYGILSIYGDSGLWIGTVEFGEIPIMNKIAGNLNPVANANIISVENETCRYELRGI